ncbi:MAG: hypothetical protein AAFU61_12525 [Pseudomonadota bacterium]
MTTIITRAYADRAAADAAVAALKKAGYLDEMIDVVNAGDGAAAALGAAEVDDLTAAAYADKMSGGQCVLVARIPFFPVGAALNAMKIADRHDPVDLGVGKTTRYERSTPSMDHAPGVMSDAPLMLGAGLEPGYSKKHRYYSTTIGWSKLISERKPPEHAIQHGYWAKLIPHLSGRKPPEHAIQHGYWGRLIPHLSERTPPDNTIDTRYWAEVIPHILRR